MLTEMDEYGKVEEKVYVALSKKWNDGKSILSWVLSHFSNSTKIFVTHVHIPPQMIPMELAKFPAHQANPSRVEAYRKQEREKAENHLNDYLSQCSKAKFQAQKLMFVFDDVAHGLVELISSHGICNLVMGASSNRQYERGMTEVRSNKAKIVKDKAHPSCKILFVCNGNLVCTRKPAPPPTKALDQQAASMPTERSDFSEGALRSDAASSTASEEGCSNYDLLSLNSRDDELEARSLHVPSLESLGSTSAREQGDIGGIFDKLQAAFADTEKYRAELNEQISKREKAELDLASFIQKAEETQNALLKGKQELEFLHKMEIEMAKNRLDLLQEERDKAVRDLKELGNDTGRGSYVALAEFSLLELQQATKNFSDSHKIGEGGFGFVYKGFLRNTMSAIKILHPQSLQSTPQFNQEVTVLSTKRHPNLVTLIGTCSERSALVYEYLPNGSLDDRLACQGGSPPLTWQVRMRITGEICRALMFLHSNKPNPIVHGDLNPANILLDANLVSKISDFGISRFLMESNTNTLVYRTESPRGTLAYMDPEFLRSGEITVKSDVYSFGIIILQLLTRKPPANIAVDVEDAIKADSLHLFIDESAGEWPFVQAKQLAHLGLRCAEMRRRERPDLESEWKLIESLMKAASVAVSPSSKSELNDKGIVPSYFMCPIFQEVMKDPQFAADGYTYEAEAIKGWFENGRKTSPMTNLPLRHLELTPNSALCSAIQEWRLNPP